MPTRSNEVVMPSEVEASLAVCREQANKDALPGIERAAFNIQRPRIVPAEGLEPTRSCDHWILSPARLPVPPRRRQASSSYEAGVIPQAFRRDREVANLVAVRKFREERLRRGGPAREQRNLAISQVVRVIV